MRSLLFGQAFFLTAHMLSAAAPAEITEYHDEATQRYLTLAPGNFGSVVVSIRFAGDPGSLNIWTGQGSRVNDKELLFARQVGEGESQGTFYLAKISESKVEVGYKPQQQAPQDAGINGTYRRVNPSKLLQLAKKEYQAANERLQQNLKAAPKTWDRRDRPALELWKDQWPALRQRWITLATVPGSTEKTAKDWQQAAQATARGYYFVATLPDPKTSTSWDGEYDDLGGGHVSLRLGKDGKLRATLTSSRLPDDFSQLEGTAQKEELAEERDGRLTARFTLPNSEIKDPAQLPKISLTKIGHYLHVETENTIRYAGKGWFDGIYRGAPVPEQQ